MIGRLPFILSLLVAITFSQHVAATDIDDGDDDANDILEGGKQKKIHEEEDEIGYIQSLIVDIPPIVSVESEYQEIEVYNSKHQTLW